MTGHRTARRTVIAVAVASAVLLAGCAGADDAPDGPADGSMEDPMPDPAGSDGSAIELPAGASDAVLLPTQDASVEIESAIADAAQHFGVDPAAIAVVSSLRVTWSDGSLGCPDADMMYTQALVDGYLITLEVDGRRVDYHGALGDEPFRCERD
jgi:hypothetical protein